MLLSITQSASLDKEYCRFISRPVVLMGPLGIPTTGDLEHATSFSSVTTWYKVDEYIHT